MPSPERSFTTRPFRGNPSRWIGIALAAAAAVLSPGPNVLAGDSPEQATSCGVHPTPDDIVALINAARARGAVCSAALAWPAAEPLAWNDRLARIAELQSRDMAALDRIAHHDALHQGLGQRLRNGGYAFSTAAENVAVGYPSLAAVVDAWLASESHCVNIMNPAVLELGVACVDGRKSGDPVQDRYWTMVVGKPKAVRVEAIQSAGVSGGDFPGRPGLVTAP